MSEHNFEKLKSHIMPLSESDLFDEAKKEWKLVGAVVNEEWSECPCGQQIKEECYLENKKNGKKTFVGNVCVNRFMGIDTGQLLAGLKRIAKDIYSHANHDVIHYARENGFLFDDKEHRFLLSTANKRKLSEKQRQWKAKINRRILNGLVVSKS
tara:strand:+ start:115 stop:576 length:462 start_codon:yes stop_codon:yes gene_type:complete